MDKTSVYSRYLNMLTCHNIVLPKIGNENVTTDDILTLLSHFPTQTGYKNVTTMSQLSSEQDKQHLTYIYAVNHEGNK